MQETIHQKNQLEANVIENDSLKKQLEGKQQLLSLANKEAEELQQRCTDFKLEIAILREQLQARTRNEEKLQSEIDASRDDLAVERRSDSLRLHCYDYQQLVPLQQAAAARARPRRAQGVHSPPEAILPPCPACSRPAPLISLRAGTTRRRRRSRQAPTWRGSTRRTCSCRRAPRRASAAVAAAAVATAEAGPGCVGRR